MSIRNAMKASVLLSSFVLATPAVFAQDKIVGGEPVQDLNEAPYMASLSGVCGASIINSKWLLTAAHCVGYYSNAKMAVLNIGETGLNIKVKRSVKHPKYQSWTNSNDFAVVELAEEIDLEAHGLRPVKLADAQFEADGYQDAGIDSTVYGWGNIKEGQSNSLKQLNKVVVPIVSHEVANAPEAYRGQLDSTMIAAGFPEGGRDACQGDSGGPMVVFDAQNEPVQVGVVSWGQGCARPNKYGVYSKVSSAYQWIMETISK